MTLRLVALMSVVLLLSLAAVGLLVTHYQERFMEEVQTTASVVGQAALRTLEWTDGAEAHFGTGVLHGRPAPSGDASAAGPETETGSADGPHDVIVERVAGGESDERFRGVKHIITTSTDDNEFTVREQLVYPAGGFPDALPGDALEGEFQACLLDRLRRLSPEDNRIFINVEAVRAETDPTQGLMLKIPRLTPARESDEPNEDGSARNVRVEFKPFAGTATTDVFLAHADEIELPIGGNYQELFSKMRNRSLFLFMGVFIVGMALSTGLASRFTRPVRQLDVGIRKLSEGDLDVAVDVHQKGEIGRLARTFNEMAGKLRANRAREREMVRREKLSALGRLAAGVAHDVRNPLHSIGLTLQHLSESARPESPEREREFDHSVDVIRGEIRRLDQLVANFLRFAKSERHERRPVDLAELIRDTLRLVQKEAERRGVGIEIDVADSLPDVRADAEAIRSTVLNLILNSFEAMPDGGTLAVSLMAANEEVVLEVADTGEGIPEEEQEHVFDFAYTTREGGNGLGLAMVHHCVVEEHGGRVALDSRLGEGTRVRVTLPQEGNGS